MTVDSARLLIVGMGGLGCPASLALARAGAERMTVIDPDAVDLTNLHRQPWFRTSDVGKPKAVVAAARLRAAFPRLEVEPLVGKVDLGNVQKLVKDHDIALDCTDQIDAKFLISDAVAPTRVPVIYGGVVRLEGQVMALLPGGPCLRCLFEQPPAAEDIPSCSRSGILGSVAGVIGALQAVTAVRVLNGEQLAGEMVVFDGRGLRQRQIRVRRRPDCLCTQAKSLPKEVGTCPA